MTFPYGETVTIVRDVTGVTDAYGDPIPATTARIDIPLCGVAPRMSSEPTERGRQGVIVGWSVYLPAGAPAVLHADILEVRGEECAVEGVPADWANPFTGWTPGAEVAVRRAAG